MICIDIVLATQLISPLKFITLARNELYVLNTFDDSVFPLAVGGWLLASASWGRFAQKAF